jgi:hypothetical protein
MQEETSAHYLCECEDLATLRHIYLGSFFLDPEDVKVSFWGNLEHKGQGCHDLDSSVRDIKGLPKTICWDRKGSNPLSIPFQPTGTYKCDTDWQCSAVVCFLWRSNTPSPPCSASRLHGVPLTAALCTDRPAAFRLTVLRKLSRITTVSEKWSIRHGDSTHTHTHGGVRRI